MNDNGLLLEVYKDGSSILWKTIDPQCDLGIKHLDEPETLYFLNALSLGVRNTHCDVKVLFNEQEV